MVYDIVLEKLNTKDIYFKKFKKLRFHTDKSYINQDTMP